MNEPSQTPQGTHPDMRWYIVYVQSGSEFAVKAELEDRIQKLRLQDYFGEILIPTEQVIQVKKGGQKVAKTKRLLPGYIFVQMVYNDDTWKVVRGCAKVGGFVGRKKGDLRPPEISEQEVRRMTAQVQTLAATKPKVKIPYSVGDLVVVKEGPFSGFQATVEELLEDKGKIKVSVSIFGRSTPVELDVHQVEKA